MRIAISADTNGGLESVVGQHFGRCPYFALVDVEGTEVQEVTMVDNPYYPNHSPGQVPNFIKSQNANVMLAGGMGRRAVMFFEQLGIHAATGAAGTVRQALEAYLGGELSEAEPCAESQAHHKAGHHHDH